MEDQELARIKQSKLKPHPREEANFLSHFFFWWEIPIIFKGWKKDISEDDLYTPLKEYESEALGDKLARLWYDEENTKKKPSLTRALIKQFGLEFAIYGILFLPIELAFSVLQPYFLQRLLDYYTPNNGNVTREKALVYAGILAILCLLRVFSFHSFTMSCTVLGMKVRVACSSLIYRKCLSLSKTSIDKITVGRVVNLLSNDATRFEQMFPFLHFVWIAPVELALGVCYIDLTLGHTSLAGIPILIGSLLFLILLSKKMTSSRIKVATKTDHRIRLMNDVICGIQAIKMYTWEKPYSEVVEDARRLETKEITIANNIRLFNGAFKIYLAKTCVFLCILVQTLNGYTLTSQYVFALNSIYENFKNSMVILLPLGAISFAETIASVRRIQELLLYDRQASNYDQNITTYGPKSTKKSKEAPGVHLKRIYVKWDRSLSTYILEDFSLNAIPGELIGVMGTAGSGKSTLFQVILNEVGAVRGQVTVGGSISYASQESWIFPSSIKQNIIFGEPFDSEKYLKVIKVCALERDLTLFPHGDQTLVGERGAMLSGGQKARINLARAIYKDADIYLLDDPLSAVDAHVGRHICDECILEYLSDKCVILVTHQIHYLKKATTIYQLEAGKVVNYGKYDQIVSSGETLPETVTEKPPKQQVLALEQHNLQSETKEHRSDSSNKVYRTYCKAAGGLVFTMFVVLLFIFSQLFVSLEDVVVTLWINLNGPNATEIEFFTTENFLYVYIGITVMTVVITHLAASVFANFCIRASKNLQKNMLHRIVYGTMDFFNHHPSGRILNRFSKDMGSIDEILPTHLHNAITVVLTTAAILIIVVVVNLWMAIPTLVLLGVTILFGIVFRSCNRNIKRTEGTTRSSVFTHISTSLQGLVTIRATNVQNELIKEFDAHQDLHSSAFYLFTSTFAAFGFWADFCAVVYTVMLIFSFFLLESQMTVGNIGLAVTQSFGLVLMVQYAMKTWGELDAQMTSVERVVEYANLDPEEDDGKDLPPETWPLNGNVVFDSVSLRYSPDIPPVLKNVTMRAHPGEKIGIVGRTGAGKTSIISVLFRLFPFDGAVVIDGVDTKTIPLNTLRSKISIIPQEPVLFLGTLRKNIDPFNEFSDFQIWEALEELELKDMISKLPSGLESPVSERGSNFSVGQRQLLCLIRAMLKNNRIIVLDEATANVDLKTDRLIQSAIRKKFKDCTVLTIAHRLNTVMDSDKILVMDSGRVVEFGSPEELLRRPGGFFHGYVMEQGGALLSSYVA